MFGGLERALNWVPDIAERRLKTGKIGVVFPDWDANTTNFLNKDVDQLAAANGFILSLYIMHVHE